MVNGIRRIGEVGMSDEDTRWPWSKINSIKLPLVEGKCPPEYDIEKQEWFYPEPDPEPDQEPYEEWYGPVCVCPDCGAEWMSRKDETNYCPKCGKQVKQE